jgi:hypothetical protein
VSSFHSKPRKAEWPYSTQGTQGISIERLGYFPALCHFKNKSRPEENPDPPERIAQVTGTPSIGLGTHSPTQLSTQVTDFTHPDGLLPYKLTRKIKKALSIDPTRPDISTVLMLVAGEGFEPSTFGL